MIQHLLNLNKLYYNINDFFEQYNHYTILQKTFKNFVNIMCSFISKYILHLHRYKICLTNLE